MNINNAQLNAKDHSDIFGDLTVDRRVIKNPSVKKVAIASAVGTAISLGSVTLTLAWIAGGGKK